MTFSSRYLLIAYALSLALAACASMNARKTAQTKILQAQQAIPEDELLDVGITVFTSQPVAGKKATREGTNKEVRNAENHFVPYHLKNTLERSGYWGMVRVTPLPSDTADLVVSGEIVESNGEYLTLKVTVTDSSGTVWLKKKYQATVTEADYDNSIPGRKDPFQGIYNTIANDMAYYMNNLDPARIREIRTISRLKFSGDFAPDVFNDYLRKDSQGIISINRLPADGDTMMQRLLSIREREYMLEDTINQYYEGFYAEMWPPYENWRQLNYTERIALGEQKQSAFLRKAGGILLVALAILMETQDVHDSGLLTGALVVAGGQVFLSGVNITKQAEMHYQALQELGESFGNQMQPMVMEFEGKQYELTGSAEEQYKRWRELLRELYYAETGFSRPGTAPDISP